MKPKNTPFSFPSPLIDAIKEEMRDCECETQAHCPAANYIEKPPADMPISPEVVNILIGDIHTVKVLINRCNACKPRVSRLHKLADQLISGLIKHSVHN